MPKPPPRRPDPPPLPTNDVRAVGVGTVLWAVGFVVLLTLRSTLERHHTGWWLWVCAVGVALGILGLVVVHRRRDRPRRTAGDQGGPPAGEPGSPAAPVS